VNREFTMIESLPKRIKPRKHSAPPKATNVVHDVKSSQYLTESLPAQAPGFIHGVSRVTSREQS